MSKYYILDQISKDIKEKKIDVHCENSKFYITMNGHADCYDIVSLGENVFSIISEGKSYNVAVVPGKETFSVEVGADRHQICLVDENHFQQRKRSGAKKNMGINEIKSPMPGKIVDVLVSVDQEVEEGDGLVIVEAMKMENEIKAQAKGTVREINVKPGDTVDSSIIMLRID